MVPKATTPLGTGSVSTPAGSASAVDLELALTALQGEVNVLPGQPTKVWRYQAEVLRGDASAVQPVEGSYSGPILRVRKGQKIRVHFRNQLPEPSIVHWHGMLVPDLMDGHPRTAVDPGQTYTYEYEVQNRAGTYWFHPHPHGLTGGQAYRGLAGMVIVTDDEEAAAGLPSGAQDLPIIIQDRTFDANNQLVYLAGDGGMGAMMGAMGMNGMMDRMMGFLGERILVNGQPDTVLPLATRAYRLRVLNGSNSRIYKLAWSDDTPMTIIGTDGGLLEAPLQRPYVTLGPGERVELWADFSGRKVGDELTLMSREFLGAEGDTLVGGGMGSMEGMMGGMQGMHGHHDAPEPAATQAPGTTGAAPANGALFPVLIVRIERAEPETLKLPARLSSFERYHLEDAGNGPQPRSFGMSMRNMQWLLNGRVFEMEGVAENEIVRLGSLEAWEFVNEQNPNEMMERMGMAHPMHIHGVQFQVVQRDLLAPELKAGFESVREGYVDEGWKDTVVVMPGERVRLLVKFVHPGLFIYHCHNLEHEDLGMMRNYRVEGSV